MKNVSRSLVTCPLPQRAIERLHFLIDVIVQRSKLTQRARGINEATRVARSTFTAYGARRRLLPWLEIPEAIERVKSSQSSCPVDLRRVPNVYQNESTGIQ